jgi:hypothetical protein
MAKVLLCSIACRATGRVYNPYIRYTGIAKTRLEWQKLNDNKMSGKRRLRIKFDDRKRIARLTKKALTWLIASLIAIILGLLLQVGEAWWPAWVITNRTELAGMLLLLVMFLILLLPIMIEFNSNPRALSGPGKNPREGWRP